MNENENPIAPNMGAEANVNPEMPVEQNNGNFTPTEPVAEAVPMQAAAAAMPVQAEAAATEAMPMAEPTPMANPAATATVPEKKSGSKTGLLIAIIAVLLLIGGGAALAILKPWEDNAKKPANTANVNNGGDENDTKSGNENENDGTGDAGSIENNQRFQDLNKFMAAMAQYQVNNSNKLPNDWSESGSFIKHYILVDGAMPKNEDGQEYVFISGMVVESDAKDEPLDSYDANAQKRNIYVFTNAKCGSDDSSISYSASKLDAAMVGVDKDMNVLCSDNQ